MRGIVVGDFVRRLVARTLAQQLGPAVESATAPFQFALSTKAGSECIAHVAQVMTDMDDNATLLSVDGIRVFDLVSRGAMMSGLLEVEWRVVHPHSLLSDSLWEDDDGVTHEIADFSQQGSMGLAAPPPPPSAVLGSEVPRTREGCSPLPPSSPLSHTAHSPQPTVHEAKTI